MQLAFPEHRISLSFRDDNTYGFEPVQAKEIPNFSGLEEGRRLPGFWLKGESSSRVDLVLPESPEKLAVYVNSRALQTVELRVEGTLFKIDFDKPGWRRVVVPGELAVDWTDRALFRLRASSPRGFRPADRGNSDTRYLGCRIAFSVLEPAS